MTGETVRVVEASATRRSAGYTSIDSFDDGGIVELGRACRQAFVILEIQLT